MHCKKRAFRDKDIALKVMHGIANKKDGRKKPVRAYECEDCGHWHLTSKPIGDMIKTAFELKLDVERSCRNRRRSRYRKLIMPEIIYRKTVDLDPLYKNPRFIRDKDFEELCKSIRENPQYFGARPIILSDRTGLLVIIAGNMRHKAAIHEGLKEVPTYLISGLTEEKEQEIIIRDNVSNGSWDYDILANEWDKEQLVEWGVPALWDLDVEDEAPAEPKLAVSKITIEFINDYQRDQCKTEIQELLRSYDGAAIK